MKKKLKLNELVKNELTNKELNEIKGGVCLLRCLDQSTYKRVYIKVQPAELDPV